ncbi:MAG: hypothetical protein DRO39_08585 [Thermoprotei archaeon]|nr:MAG: hypothetical protein DRO39_08585 [Thermoprotei archaeon]
MSLRRGRRRRKRFNGNDKVHLHVMISRELYTKVKELASRVYDCHRGALSYAVEEALEMWLATHTQAHRVNPRMPLRERYNAVIRCLEFEMDEVSRVVHQVFLERCIMNEFDVKDPRTVYGWLHRFYQAGLIKPLTVERPLKPRDWARNRVVELVAIRV